MAESITLAKALSIKNRLAGRLALTRTTMETYNSVMAGQLPSEAVGSVDVRAEFARLLKTQDALVAIKAAIQRANATIYEAVLQLGEKKSLIQLLSGLNTKQGTEPAFGGIEYRYVATITKPEVLEMVRKLEAEIDTLQDSLNQHNAVTKIEISSEILDLAR